ncbi:hypothetical protein [Flavobacterium silvaticum]|uniref:Uncharacterized protein n=1 Tax=Flavobacterium silvaticum TaxID=1852020 RepID=A0A972FTW5_9FLAO|nr:hypothetical protein [Flavobacterium silvaticum]NMH27922.1 hypothetical protein [Flavobacterium silvaticum]
MNTTLLIAVALSFSQLSHAQLGGLIKRGTKSDEKVVASKTALDWNQYPQKPAVTFKTLLDNTELLTEGELRPNYYRATFIPNRDTKGNGVSFLTDYNLCMIKTYLDGQLIKEVVYPAGNYFEGDKQISFMEEKSKNEIELTKPGKYRLDFYAGGTQFYSFEFDVNKKTNDDAYGKIPFIWYASGPWEKYGYLENQSSGSLIFGYYNRHLDFKPDPNNADVTGKSIEWTADLYKDGKMISVPMKKKKETVSLGTWKPYSTAFKDAKDYIKTSSLSDGNYTVKVQITGEDKPWTYDFVVKNKQIIPAEKQDKTKNDPKTVIEGWNNVFWIERK